jgi:hypothetical protein
MAFFSGLARLRTSAAPVGDVSQHGFYHLAAASAHALVRTDDLTDLGLCRSRRAIQEGLHVHNDPGPAVPALEVLRLADHFLQRVWHTSRSEPFERCHHLAVHGVHRNLARSHRPTAHHDHARPAPTLTAAESRFAESEGVAQDHDQRNPWIHSDFARLSVHNTLDHARPLPLVTRHDQDCYPAIADTARYFFLMVNFAPEIPMLHPSPFPARASVAVPLVRTLASVDFTAPASAPASA